MPKKPQAQLELFAGHDERDVHALGLLGWRDPLWTRRFTIELLNGQHLFTNLITIRRLHAVAKSDPASAAEKTPNP